MSFRKGASDRFDTIFQLLSAFTIDGVKEHLCPFSMLDEAVEKPEFQRLMENAHAAVFNGTKPDLIGVDGRFPAASASYHQCGGRVN
jgi:hypothetical protein